MSTSNTDTLTPDITNLDAVTLATRIKEREISCREVMSAYLDRIETVNGAVNAIVSRVSVEQLLAQADAKDALLSSGQYQGPLHGFPQAPKDLAGVVDMPTSFGSPIFAGKPAAADVVFVERMRQGGAIFVGRTNTPEFGLGGQTYNPVFGATKNPWDLSKTCAGSSGGAAVSVATRMLPLADGSDMMGSLRTPAAFTNVFGFRGSRGLVPAGPTPDIYLNQFSTDGAMARNVPDIALLMGVISGYDARVPLSVRSDPAQFKQSLEADFSGKRIGWLGDIDGYLAVEPEVIAVCETAVKNFEAIGARVEKIGQKELAFPMESLFDAWITLRSFLMAGNQRANYQDPAKRALLKPEMIWEVERGLRMPAMDVFAASARRSAWHQRLVALFNSYDFLVLPGAQLFPFDVTTHWPRQIAGREMDTYHRWMEVVIMATLGGCPVMSAPAGFSAAGLPMGIQIIGPGLGDMDVLKIAHAYDTARGGAANARAPLLG